MSAGFETAESFRKWRFTWEAVSHIPFLRLVVFAPHINPSILCKKLKVNLNLEAFQLTLSWIEENEVSLKVPVPRVLVDVETPVNFMLFEDHIEVKLVLLLPVDHPIVLNFGTALTLTEDEVCHEESLIVLDLQPLRIDSEVASTMELQKKRAHPFGIKEGMKLKVQVLAMAMAVASRSIVGLTQSQMMEFVQIGAG